MLTRHKSREIVLQTLFNLDFRFGVNNMNEEKALEIYENIGKTLYGFSKEDNDNFSKKLLVEILKNKESIDKIIIKTTPDWGLEKTGILDRNILRLGLCEMLFSGLGVPPRVVINESIELAKTFGQKKSYKFVSGVLGTIYETANLEERNKKLDSKTKKVVKKKKVGALPYYLKGEDIMILMAHNIFNKWTLPKGSFDNSLKSIEGNLEMIMKEKLNAEGIVEERLGENKYRAGENKKEIISKSISYYLFNITNPNEVKLNKERKGLNNLKWISLKKFKEIDKYDDLEKVFEKGIKLILEKKK